jgi:uncharacterized protein YkwD
MNPHLNFAVHGLFSIVKPAFITSTPVLLGVLAFCFTGSAQTLRPVPLARLVSESASELAHASSRADSTAEGLSTGSGLVVLPSISDATVIERRAFERTNEEREKVGLAPLVWDAALFRMARIHSENMARLNFFAHETPEGLQLKDRARSIGIPHFRVIAENIAYNKGYQDPGAFAVERWMISAGHRANILYVGFQASAIGSYVSTDGSVYLTQVFINR